MSEKWTPGPWKVAKDHPEIHVTTNEPEPWYVCRVTHYCNAHGSDAGEEVSANANLIAAAPELLKACEAALVFCESAAKEIVDEEYQRLVVAPLRAAISKAKGQS